MRRCSRLLACLLLALPPATTLPAAGNITLETAMTSRGAAGRTADSTPTPPGPGDAAYWTAGRLDVAAPITKGPLGTNADTTRQAPAGTPQGRFINGVPQVGTFFVSTPDGNTSCTGSLVHSPGHDLALTAGHCAWGWRRAGAHRIFVPAYAYGKDAAHQPYGYFPVEKLFLDPGYRPSPSTGAATDLDFAFARLGRDSRKRRAEDVAGAFTLRATPSYRNTVTVIGYPESSHNPQRRPITCTVPTTRLPGYRQMSMVCGGYFDGVSGSPWITGYNPTTGAGQVIGEVGGRGGGGDNQDDDWISYSPYYGHEIMSLYAQASKS